MRLSSAFSRHSESSPKEPLPAQNLASQIEQDNEQSANRSSLPLSIVSDTSDGAQQGQFMEEVLNAVQPSNGDVNDNHKYLRDSTGRPDSRDISINPASIPTRTSSSHALSSDKTASPRGHRKRRSGYHSRQSSRTQNSIAEEPKSPDSSNRDSDPLKSSTLMSSFPLPPTQQTVETRADHDVRDVAESSNRDILGGDLTPWTTEKENILRGPFDYLEAHPGKDIRGEMIAAFNIWLQVPAASLEIITKVVGMLHTASLLIDDVEDSSLLRRGVPVAHSIFGTAQTINSANYVYFCALQELLRLSNPDAVRIYTEELLNLHRGQGMDLFWRDTLTCPSEDDYLEMVGNKTGGLFRLAIKLMCAESPSHVQGSTQADYIPLVNTIGLLFQILDDYRNLSDTTYTANKGLCEDLTEGKFSFPVIHSIRSDPSNLVLINILKQKTNDEEVKRYALTYMERTGSFAYTRRVLRGLTKKALALVEEVDAGRGKGDRITAILERLKVDRQAKTASVALS